jgi:predicted  nucleic acid-binding Zn-ribbon protein
LKDLIQILEKIQSSPISVLQFSKNIGINQDRIYSWIKGKAKPKPEDFEKLKRWYREEMGLPQEFTADDVQNLKNEVYLLQEELKKKNAVIEHLHDRIKNLEIELNNTRAPVIQKKQAADRRS